MLKMFTTQLTGLFSRLHSKEEMAIEDAARLLAQAIAGEGHIYLKGFGEMQGAVIEALYGEEPLKGALELNEPEILDQADRALIFARRSTDAEAISLGQKLAEKNIPFVVVCGKVKDAEGDIMESADINLNTQVVKGLLPDDEGNRYGFPSLLAALYLYHGIKFTLDEMLDEE
ncbi:DUF2529 domain-containing protein [Jeotgalibacillus proteolyticus]|uniref:DUF2529 domain-containing protein n=1 Tax=Jeotgalibacillus proteolyticus TaxID=2082395 RepID=A0A2S5G9J5_9BACL|nr:DUF2529 domain-containing protein [Jeotgalibacillus proteolyticus]PPA69649.1 DUF2529 domain-containing protein [Jeotgalibacillus proteolyticus]